MPFLFKPECKEQNLPDVIGAADEWQLVAAGDALTPEQVAHSIADRSGLRLPNDHSARSGHVMCVSRGGCRVRVT